MRSLQKRQPAVCPNDSKLDDPQRKDVRDVGPCDAGEEAVASRFLAEEGAPSIRSVHVERADEEEAEGADDAEGDVKFGRRVAEQRLLGRHEIAPIEPREDEGNKVDVEEK